MRSSDQTWYAHVVTLFPEMFPGPLGLSLAGKGLADGRWRLETTALRDFGEGPRRTVDDTSYGHQAGMILKPDIVHAALTAAKVRCFGRPRILYMSPRGQPFTQKMAHEFADSDGVLILCGRYEGIDERVIELWREEEGLEEISLGDFILSGGELAALTIVDACVRLLPNIVHSEESLRLESFELDLLEFPQYTKPYSWQGKVVPEILRSGDHKKIAAWQKQQAENITQVRRPDLWEKYLEKKGNLTSGKGLARHER